MWESVWSALFHLCKWACQNATGCSRLRKPGCPDFRTPRGELGTPEQHTAHWFVVVLGNVLFRVEDSKWRVINGDKSKLELERAAGFYKEIGVTSSRLQGFMQLQDWSDDMEQTTGFTVTVGWPLCTKEWWTVTVSVNHGRCVITKISGEERKIPLVFIQWFIN